MPVFLLAKMIKLLLAKKIGMTQVFEGDKVHPVTLVQAGQMTVIREKTKEADGYQALQLGFGARKEKNVAKPQKGQWKGIGTFEVVREARDLSGKARGEALDVNQFKEGEVVKVSGVSKSKGFQGVVKRHGFHGAPKTHGTKHAHRQPGSIGATWPQRVIKGRRMAGRMGGDRVTLKSVKVIKIDPEKQLMALRGAVPGRRGTLLEIRG